MNAICPFPFWVSIKIIQKIPDSIISHIHICMIEPMVVRELPLDVRPIACSCKKSYDKVITRAILSYPRTTLTCSRAPAAYWRKTVRKILCVCFVQRSFSDASDRACSVRPYFYLRLFLRMHSDQTEFCVSYDFLIASSREPIVKAPLAAHVLCLLPW